MTETGFNFLVWMGWLDAKKGGPRKTHLKIAADDENVNSVPLTLFAGPFDCGVDCVERAMALSGVLAVVLLW